MDALPLRLLVDSLQHDAHDDDRRRRLRAEWAALAPDERGRLEADLACDARHDAVTAAMVAVEALERIERHPLSRALRLLDRLRLTGWR